LATLRKSENGLAQRFAAAPQAAIVISTDPRRRWRLAEPGVVLHSVDGGSSWETQQTGVSVALTAGASPSPSVCWLVGSGGTVVLSTDGHSWQPIAFPQKIDLVSVRAIDDKAAVVSAADGRAFSTSDRGVTWSR
jgi:photosystem II stability/assembly factor-like uncharacterized protein